MTNREKDLLVFGKPVLCPVCKKTSYLYPKAVGYQPYIWEVNCGSCHVFDLGINACNPGHEQLHNSLSKLRERYFNGETSAVFVEDIKELARVYDQTLKNRVCVCGGNFSIAANPKCIHCDVDIFNSYFHYAYIADFIQALHLHNENMN
jgi:hypothetical protein